MSNSVVELLATFRLVWIATSHQATPKDCFVRAFDLNKVVLSRAS